VVAVDAAPAARQSITGTELYALELLRRLPAAAPWCDFVQYSSRPGPRSGLDLTVLPTRRLWAQVRLPIRLHRTRPELFFSPAHVVPVLAPGPSLTVVHDLAFERWPKAYPARQRAYLQFTTRWAARRCPLLITVSKSTGRDLELYYGVGPERIVVVSPGLTPPPPPPSAAQVSDRLRRLGIERPFALQVGRVEARKNQLSALRAVELAGELDYVSAGAIEDSALAQTLARSPRARILGRTSPADLEALYAGAEVVLVASLYEGFGFPVLEAMARGVPVVAADNSSLPEVGADAALYVGDTSDQREFATAINRARSESPALAERGRLRAQAFSWEQTAAGVAEVVRRLIG